MLQHRSVNTPLLFLVLLFLLLGGGHGVISAFLTGLDDLVKTRGFSKGDGHRFRSFAGMMTCACSSLMRCIPTQYIGQKTWLDLWCRLWVPRSMHVCDRCFPHKMLCILPASSCSSLTIIQVDRALQSSLSKAVAIFYEIVCCFCTILFANRHAHLTVLGTG